METTLTDVEIQGLSAAASLADGHAYQDLGPFFGRIISDLPAVWAEAQRNSVPDMERQYKHSFAALIGSGVLEATDNFVICPTASNSIDIIGALLAARRMRAALIEPTFDNLALLLKRRGVDAIPLDESLLHSAAETECLGDLLKMKRFDALFIVKPNNPTGRVIGRSVFQKIVSFCVENAILLVIDNSFRLHCREPYDDYVELSRSGVSFIAFEDTGKVFPTLDMKASLLAYSTDNRRMVESIYRELFLCVSNFSLAVLTKFIEVTREVGISRAIWQTVDQHREILRNALASSPLRIPPESLSSTLSVEWIDCSGVCKCDLDVCKALEAEGVTILPGRMFFWHSARLKENQHNVRVSLMRSHQTFLSGVRVLGDIGTKFRAIERAVATA
ncbi:MULTISPECIES: aminotransferase class I/II-fold pyridoxal phosphate-dependent enzyme [unclassified Bradyrhizobium]|uniref:aminotransferase class I/II-fold pyridoxal phosphate-dependent enzyme n=1 Tax=unclassified Bradyrhizobium TaxID=2631580 RepID=UPI00291650FC|nr:MULTISPECIES: aminotransferase class I/II-fold pyridoxal phosphate-dependent enzyme [unclassified Bradyrhizobium]